MRLLLAEDERTMAEPISAFLQYHKYTVDWVDNGTDAYHQAATQAYDGLILDIMMPGMDGLEVLSRLRKEGKNMPVLLLTAKSEIEDRIRGLESGADDYLPKPFDISELLARVRAMLRRRDTYHSDTLSFGDLELTPDTCQLSANGKTVSLSRREYQLMELLQGKSNWSGNIRYQVDRLEELVKQLLLLARLDEKQWAGKTAVLDFSRELEKEIGIYEETILQKDLKLTADIAEGLRIKGDETSVHQLIHALLDNAMQYTPSGGGVWVSAGREKKLLRLEVTNAVDALPQIAPERLLDRFTRGDNARSRKNGGTGIGLSTAKSIVDLCHGSISVSYPDDGRFQVVVRMPLSV